MDREPIKSEQITTAILKSERFKSSKVYYLRAKARFLQNNYMGALKDIKEAKMLDTENYSELYNLR